ncbi:MAG TPA: DUF1587 domain-containing protein [Longimicrobiaceae bacterium]|nr:DUF1587 domain-containing protein [Longimicrobiaceae bacterium]
MPLLETYCVSCHGSKRAKADLESRRDPAHVLADGRIWESVLRMVSEHEMPPGKAKQPTNAERQTILDGVRAELAKLDCSEQIDPGRPTLRRLNETEYENTIRDLVGVEFEADFPDDEIGFSDSASTTSGRS